MYNNMSENAKYDRLNQIKEELNSIIKDILTNSEELKNFVKFKRANFKDYSMRNTMLIYKQNKNASCVAGFHKWKELGGVIRKGSKAIKILVPLLKEDENNKKKIYGYKYVNVFDISQVEGDLKIPEININLENEKMIINDADLYKGTLDVVSEITKINEIDILGAYGFTDGKSITISKAEKSLVNKASIIIHELVHYLNHFNEDRKLLSKERKEVEAEIGSLIFGSYFDLNIKNIYNYIACYSDGVDLISCFDKTYKTIENILVKIEEKIIINKY